jgi:hypothetical protein
LFSYVIVTLPYTIAQQVLAALNNWARMKCRYVPNSSDDTTILLFTYKEDRDKVTIQKALKQFLSWSGCNVTTLGLAKNAAWLEVMSSLQFSQGFTRCKSSLLNLTVTHADLHSILG